MKVFFLFVSFYLISFHSYCQLFKGISKWINKEVVPTIKGKRPLKIDPNRIRISQNGKDIFRASTEGEGMVYIDFGIGKIQSGNLKKDIAKTIAFMRGDVAVMTQVAYEQLNAIQKQQLKRAEERKEILISNQPPNYEDNEVAYDNVDNNIILYNHTNNTLNYAINNKLYSLPPDKGFKHITNNGKFFLQYDGDPNEGVVIKRYYLTKKVYVLSYSVEDTEIKINPFE